MSECIQIIVLGFEQETRAKIVAGLAQSPSFEVAGETSEPEQVQAELTRNPDLAVYLDLEEDAEKLLSWLEALPIPKPAILAGGPDDDPALILRTMRAGAVAYFPAHAFDEELDRARERLVKPTPAEPEGGLTGRVVGLLGAKGGVGTTTIACELGAVLQRGGERVVLVDAKPYFGDVALHLDAPSLHTLGDPLARGQEVDASFLETVVTEHAASGLFVVAAPVDPDEAEGVDAAQLQRVCEFLRQHFDWVLVDLPRLTDELTIGAIDIADQVVVVTVPTLAGVARARQHQGFLGELGVDESKIRLVVNRAHRGDLFSDDPSEVAGLEPCARIPSDEGLASAMESGRPLLSKSASGETSQAIVALVEALRPSDGQARENENQDGLRVRIRRFVEDVQCRLASA